MHSSSILKRKADCYSDDSGSEVEITDVTLNENSHNIKMDNDGKRTKYIHTSMVHDISSSSDSDDDAIPLSSGIPGLKERLARAQAGNVSHSTLLNKPQQKTSIERTVTITQHQLDVNEPVSEDELPELDDCSQTEAFSVPSSSVASYYDDSQESLGSSSYSCTDSVSSTLSFTSKNKMSKFKGERDVEKQRKKEERERQKEERRMKLEVDRQQKAQAKLEKDMAKREAQKDKQLEAARKRTLQEARRNAKPGHCLKLLTVIVDPGLMQYPCGPAIVAKLQSGPEESCVKYEVSPQCRPNLISFWRQVTEVKETEHGPETMSSEEVAEEVVQFIPIPEFVLMVEAYKQTGYSLSGSGGDRTLRQYVQEIQRFLEGRKVTLIIEGIEEYFRNSRPGAAKKRKNTPAPASPVVSRVEVEEALIDVQIQTGCNVRFVDTPDQVAKTVLQYAKAVAEAPGKRDRLVTGFTFHIESSNCVKVDKEGRGLKQVWRKQIQQYKNVGAEVANAITALYPSPRSLYEAYMSCNSQREAELLLQDLVVRRGAGVMETSRRIGKEHSRRMWQLLTNTDSNLVIK